MPLPTSLTWPDPFRAGPPELQGLVALGAHTERVWPRETSCLPPPGPAMEYRCAEQLIKETLTSWELSMLQWEMDLVPWMHIVPDL